MLLNAVDRPAQCSFIAPAVVRRGDLLVAISTSGTSPTLASRLRRRLEAEFGPEYADLLRVLGHLRRRFAKEGMNGEDRRRIFSALVDSPLAGHLRDGDWGRGQTACLRKLSGRITPCRRSVCRAESS